MHTNQHFSKNTNTKPRKDYAEFAKGASRGQKRNKPQRGKNREGL